MIKKFHKEKTIAYSKIVVGAGLIVCGTIYVSIPALKTSVLPSGRIKAGGYNIPAGICLIYLGTKFFRSGINQLEQIDKTEDKR